MSRLTHHSPKYKDAEGRFGISYHLEMLQDQTIYFKRLD